MTFTLYGHENVHIHVTLITRLSNGQLEYISFRRIELVKTIEINLQRAETKRWNGAFICKFKTIASVFIHVEQSSEGESYKINSPSNTLLISERSHVRNWFISEWRPLLKCNFHDYITNTPYSPGGRSNKVGYLATSNKSFIRNFHVPPVPQL